MGLKISTGGSITNTASYHANQEACEIMIAYEGKGMTGGKVAALNHYFQRNPDILLFSTLGFAHKVIKDFLLLKLGGGIYY